MGVLRATAQGSWAEREAGLKVSGPGQALAPQPLALHCSLFPSALSIMENRKTVAGERDAAITGQGQDSWLGACRRRVGLGQCWTRRPLLSQRSPMGCQALAQVALQGHHC